MRACDIIAVVIIVSVIIAASFLPRVGRLVGAAVVCLFSLAILIPSLGSVRLPNHKTGYGWQDAFAVAMIIVPCILIFVGAARSKTVERIGWFLAVVFLGILFSE